MGIKWLPSEGGDKFDNLETGAAACWDAEGGSKGTSLAFDGASDVELSLEDDGFLRRGLVPLWGAPDDMSTSDVVEDEEEGRGGLL